MATSTVDRGVFIKETWGYSGSLACSSECEDGDNFSSEGAERRYTGNTADLGRHRGINGEGRKTGCDQDTD